MSPNSAERAPMLAQIGQLLQAGNWTAVLAPRFSGKSAFSEALRSYLEEKYPAWACVSVELSQAVTIENARDQLCNAIASQLGATAQAWGASSLVDDLTGLVQANDRRILCILLNGLDSVPDEVLTALASDLRRFHDCFDNNVKERFRLALFGGAKVMHLSCSEYSPLHGVLNTFELGDLSREETSTLFSREIGQGEFPVPSEVVDAVQEQTAGYRYLVLALAKAVKASRNNLTPEGICQVAQQWATDVQSGVLQDDLFSVVATALETDVRLFHLVREMIEQVGQVPADSAGAEAAILSGIAGRRGDRLVFRGRMVERAVGKYLDDVRLADYCCLHGDWETAIRYYAKAGNAAVRQRRGGHLSVSSMSVVDLFVGANQHAASIRKPEQVYGQIVQIARGILGADRAFLWRLDPIDRKQAVWIASTEDRGLDSTFSREPNDTVSAAARNHTVSILRGNRGVVVGIGGDPEHVNWALELSFDSGITGQWLRSALHQAEAALYSTLDHAYRRDEAFRRQAQHRSLIHRVALSLQAASKVEEVFGLIVDGARDTLRYECAQLSLVFPEEGLIRGVRSNGAFESIQLKTVRALGGPDLLAQVVRDHGTRIVDDCTDPGSACAADEIRESGLKSQVVVPLTRGERVIGTLQVGSTKEKHAFRPDDVSLFQLLADQAAIAIEMAREREALETALQVAQDAMVRVDASDLVVSFNDAYKRLFKPVVGQLAPLSCAEGDRDTPLMRRAFQQKRPLQTVRQVGQDSSDPPHIVTACATTDSFGRYAGGVEVLSSNLMSGLAAALNKLVAVEDVDALGQSIVELICRYLGYARARFYWKNSIGTALVSHWCFGMPDEVAAKFKNGEYDLPAPPPGQSGPDFECFAEGRPLVVVSIESAGGSTPANEVSTDKELRRVLVHRWEDSRYRFDLYRDRPQERIDVPVGTLAEPLGKISIDFGEDTGRRFRHEDQERLALVSEWTKYVMKRVLDLRAAKQEADAARHVHLSRDRQGLDMVLWDFALRNTMQGPSFNRVAVFLAAPFAQSLHGYVCHGAATGQEWEAAVAQSVRNPPTPQFIQNEARLRAGGKVPESERQPLDRFREITVVPGLQQGLLAEVVRTRAPTDVANANTTMADFYQRIGWEPVPSAYVCPMVFEDQCEGLIYVDKTFGKDRLTEWDRQVLQIAAVSLAGTAREHRLSRELRDQILSLSHSGITPYATIHACAQELDSRVQGKIERQMLTLIQSEARRGEEVIRRLLRYQQATTVGIVANVQEVDILALIKERVRPYLAILEVRGIRFDLSMPQSPLLVQADPDLLGLALAELATNAFLAVQNSPLPMSARFITVRASIGAEGHKCLVTVGNCGDPIPSTTRGLLFEPFVSGRGSTGLGLWIAREMARKQQGDVWYDERAACPTFVLAFPIAEQKKGEGAQ